MKTPSKREILVLTGHLCPKCDEFTEFVESSEIYGTDFGLLYRSAHRLFDDMWKSGDMNREDAYAWLSKRLGIPRFLTHVGMFDEAQCRRTIELCKAYAKEEGIRRI